MGTITDTMRAEHPSAAAGRNCGPPQLLLLPASALASEAPGISALAAEAVVPNPFFLPDFLGPALHAFGHGRVELLIVRASCGPSFFAPVETGGRKEPFPRLRVWTHPYAPLGQPLIHRERTGETAAALMAAIKAQGSAVAVPDVPLSSPDTMLMRAAAEAAGARVRLAAERERPILHTCDPAGAAGFDAALGRKRRKEMARQLRRLGERGAVTIDEVTLGPRIAAALETFMALEASGWKGRAATAMSQDRSVRTFVHTAVRGLAANGNAALDIMRCGDRPVAALIRLMAGSVAVPWKIAFDESFSAYSPGAQLMAKVSRQWLESAAVARVDPVCEEGNALLAHLWSESEPYGTLYVDFGRTGLQTAAAAALEDARHALRGAARRLLPRRITRAARRRR